MVRCCLKCAMIDVAKFGIVIVGRKIFFKTYPPRNHQEMLALARDKKTNALGPYVCDWHSIVVVSKGPFRVGSGGVGIGGGGAGCNLRVPPCFVPCRAVPPWGGGGGQRGLVPRNACCTEGGGGVFSRALNKIVSKCHCVVVLCYVWFCVMPCFVIYPLSVSQFLDEEM